MAKRHAGSGSVSDRTQMGQDLSAMAFVLVLDLGGV
jgi:hypothetical protein